MGYRVLVTDIGWPDLRIEAELLGRIGAEIVYEPGADTARLIDLAPQVDAIMTCWAKVPAAVLDAAPRCLTVARFGVGVDNIDVGRATELGIVVSNVPGYCTDEVADHTLMMILGLARGVAALTRQTRAGGWDSRPAASLPRLRGLTLGLVGFGAIAQAVAVRGQVCGLAVVAQVRDPARVSNGRGPGGVEFVGSLTELLDRTDVLSLHVPLTAGTRGMIGASELAAMRPGTLLVNTARGALVDTDALVDALSHGPLAGAGLDVTEPEPLPSDHPLRTLDNVILTPHAAFASAGALAELATRAAGNVVAVLTGHEPGSVVNPEVLTVARASRLRPD